MGYNADGQTYRGITDENGMYQMTGLPSGTYQVYAYKEGFLQSQEISIILEAVPVSMIQDFALTPSAIISGTIKDSEGQPIEGATIIVTGETGFSMGQTDETGSYMIDDLPSGTYSIEVWADGFIEQEMADQEIYEGHTLSMLDFSLIAGNTAEIRVTEDDGITPIEDSEITLIANTGEYYFNKTDADGNAFFNTLVPGVYYLKVSAQGHVTHQQMFEVPDDTTPVILSVSLSTGATLSGVITSTDGYTPVEGAFVILWNDLNAVVAETFTDINGAYQFLSVPDGTYSLQVIHESLAYNTESVTIVDNNNMAIDFFAVPGNLQGIVTSFVTGQPVEGAEVTIILSGSHDSEALALQTLTDEFGEYQFNSLLSGKYWIIVEAQNLARAAQYVIIDNSESVDLDLPLVQPVIIQGTVRDADTQLPISGASVSIQSSQALADDPGLFMTTDDFGNFQFTSLPEGSYHLITQVSDYPFFDTNIIVDAGGRDIDIDMSQEGAEVLVNVRDEATDLPVAGAIVMLTKDSQIIAYGKSGHEGTINLSPIHYGNYELIVSVHSTHCVSEISVTSGFEKNTISLLLPLLTDINKINVINLRQRNFDQEYVYISDNTEILGLGRSRIVYLIRAKSSNTLYSEAGFSDPVTWHERGEARFYKPIEPLCQSAYVSMKEGDLQGPLSFWYTWFSKQYSEGEWTDTYDLYKELEGMERAYRFLLEGKDRLRSELYENILSFSASLLGYLFVAPKYGSKIKKAYDLTKNLIVYFNEYTFGEIEEKLRAIADLIIPGFGETLTLIEGLENAVDLSFIGDDIDKAIKNYKAKRKEYEANKDKAIAGFDKYYDEYKTYKFFASHDCCWLCCSNFKSSRIDCEPINCDSDCKDKEKLLQQKDKGNKAGDASALGSTDPNDKLISIGFGNLFYIFTDDEIIYTIRFENQKDALASAQLITVTDPLSPNLDWSTFELGDMEFSNHHVEVPEGLIYYYTRVDLRPEGNDLFVDIEAEFDPETGIATWIFSAIDPETGEFTEDVLAGFLPPNGENHEGEGFVKFSIKPRQTIPTGTVIDNIATIVFDWNPPIDTPRIFNTIDAEAPSSHVLPLPAQSRQHFEVTWEGQDDEDGSGIAS